MDAVTQARPADPMAAEQAKLDGYEKQQQALQAEEQKSEADIRSRQAAAEAPLMQRQQAANAEFGQMLERGPEQVALPKPEVQRASSKDMMDAAQPLMTLAALAGLMTRRPLIASLKGMTAAMEGIKAGDDARYEQGMKEYQQHLQTAVDLNNQKLKEYDRILKSRQFNIREIDAQMRAVAKRYGDESVANARTFKERFQLIDSNRKATEQNMNRLERAREADMRRQEARERLAETRQFHSASLGMQRERLDLAKEKEKVKAATAGGHGGSAGAAPGSVNARMAGRQVESILGATVHIENISNLPEGASIGAFGEAAIAHNGNAMKALISQAITPAEDRLFQQMAAGLENELAAIGSSGGAGGAGRLVTELQSIRPRENDPKEAMFTYLALARQALEVGMHGLEVWPAASEEQKALARGYVGRLKDVVPWTVADVTRVVRERKGGPTITESATRALSPAPAAPAKPQTATVGGKTYSKPAGMSDADWTAYKKEVGAQ